MVSAPRTAAVRLGTAMMAASRQRTRQLTRANRDREEPGRFGCGWVAETMLAGGGTAPASAWSAAVPGCGAGGPPAGFCATAGCGPVAATSRLVGAPLTALPPARSPGPPPSACPPLTSPGPPPDSPGFVTDRLRTTFAPRIGKPGQHACRGKTAEAGQHTHPSFPHRNDGRCSWLQGGRGHTLALQNG